jgi:NADPH:quinone reductase-like Zn-dependent oxidoreductase
VTGLFFPNWKEGAVTPEKTRVPLGSSTRDGVLQEYVVFDEDQVVKVPGYLTPAETATLPCAALTAWNALIEKGKGVISQIGVIDELRARSKLVS